MCTAIRRSELFRAQPTAETFVRAAGSGALLEVQYLSLQDF